jgi:hypothetical protein
MNHAAGSHHFGVVQTTFPGPFQLKAVRTSGLDQTTLGWNRPANVVRTSQVRDEPLILEHFYILRCPSVLHLCTLVRLDWRGDSDTTGIGTLAGLYMLREILIN